MSATFFDIENKRPTIRFSFVFQRNSPSINLIYDIHISVFLPIIAIVFARYRFRYSFRSVFIIY